MSILYLLTSPQPPIDGTDAVFNEISTLRAAFGGSTINLFPLTQPSGRFPKSLYGLHKVSLLRRSEQQHRLNHIYFPILHWFPVLQLLRNPIIYTVSASLEPHPPPRNLTRLGTIKRIVVSNVRDADILRSWGLTNYELIPPGIDTSQISRQPRDLEGELILLMASAPWEMAQFSLKGLDELLEAACKLPYLKLILMWRGLFLDELTERVARHGLHARVEIVNHKADMNSHLARAHGTVLLAKRSDVVKAYPHSLVESLIAGKPVLVSDKIPIGDDVRRRGCGIVLPEVSVPVLVDAIEALRQNYKSLVRNTVVIRPDAFSLSSLIENHRQLYGTVG